MVSRGVYLGAWAGESATAGGAADPRWHGMFGAAHAKPPPRRSGELQQSPCAQERGEEACGVGVSAV